MGTEPPPDCPMSCLRPPEPEPEEELSTKTCGCGYGYYRQDRSWVSGADVRAGLQPTRDGVMMKKENEGSAAVENSA
jgi:hypothetical protein